MDLLPVLRVITYNIQHGRNLAGSLNLKECGRELAELAPDLVFLQEADCHRWGTLLRNQPRVLAGRLGLRHVYGPVRKYCPGSYGNAMLSRYPIQFVKNHLMTPATDRRCCLEAELTLGGREVRVLGLHLALKSADRMKQLQETLIPLVQGIEQPCIVAGDFNSRPGSPELQLLLEHLTDSFAANRGPELNSYPSDHPTIRIDYIFTANCQTETCRIISDARASDHLPVLAEIVLP